MSEIQYKELFCNVCGDFTSHVEVDTELGPDDKIVKKWSCEICGSYHDEGGEE